MLLGKAQLRVNEQMSVLRPCRPAIERADPHLQADDKASVQQDLLAHRWAQPCGEPSVVPLGTSLTRKDQLPDAVSKGPASPRPRENSPRDIIGRPHMVSTNNHLRCSFDDKLLGRSDLQFPPPVRPYRMFSVATKALGAMLNVPRAALAESRKLGSANLLLTINGPVRELPLQVLLR